MSFIDAQKIHTKRELWVRSALTTLIIAVLTTFTTRAVFDELFPQFGPDVQIATSVFAFVMTCVMALPLLIGFGYMSLELTQANKKLAFFANRDPLTGLMNRRAFAEEFELRSRDAKAKKQAGMMMLIDADRFKAINDTYGHDGGDEVLVHLARTLEAASSASAFVGRLGGEEFVVCDFGPQASRAAAERLCSAVSGHPVEIHGKPLTVTVSVGCKTFAPGADLAAIMRCADIAVYEAKAAGRNRVIEHVDVVPSLAPRASDIAGRQRPKTKRARNPESSTASS